MPMVPWALRMAVLALGLSVCTSAQDSPPRCRDWPDILASADYYNCYPERLLINQCMTYTAAEYLRICQNRACRALVATIRAKEATECVVGIIAPCLLYAGILNPLETVCNSLQVPTETPRPSATTSPPESPPSSPAPRPASSSPLTSPSKTPRSTSTPPHPPTPSNTEDDEASNSPQHSPQSSVEPSSASPSPSQVPRTTLSASSESGSAETSAVPTLVPSQSENSSSTSASRATASTGSDQSGSMTMVPTDERDSSVHEASVQPDTSVLASWILWTAIGGVVIGVIVIVVWKRKRSQDAKSDGSQGQATTEGGSSMYSGMVDETPTRSTDTSSRSAVTKLEELETWRIDASAISDLSLISAGGQGAVFVIKLNNSRLFASKRLTRSSFSAVRLHQFIDEIRLHASLHHPSVVTFVGVAWTSPFDLQALFEYMSNGDLRTYLDTHVHDLQRGMWDVTQLTIAVDVAEALVYVHSFNPPIVHRDVKARNVMLSEQLRAKLTDFGVAREQSENGTMTTGVGTSRWLAPEVIRGMGKYTKQCDIYSFGMLMIELETNRMPYADVVGLSEIELLGRVANGKLRPAVSDVRSAAVREIIQGCLEHDPAKRIGAMEVSFRLRNAIKERIAGH